MAAAALSDCRNGRIRLSSSIRSAIVSLWLFNNVGTIVKNESRRCKTSVKTAYQHRSICAARSIPAQRGGVLPAALLEGAAYVLTASAARRGTRSPPQGWRRYSRHWGEHPLEALRCRRLRGVPSVAARPRRVPSVAARLQGVPSVVARPRGVPSEAARLQGVPSAVVRLWGVPSAARPPPAPCRALRRRTAGSLCRACPRARAGGPSGPLPPPAGLRRALRRTRTRLRRTTGPATPRGFSVSQDSSDGITT